MYFIEPESVSHWTPCHHPVIITRGATDKWGFVESRPPLIGDHKIKTPSDPYRIGSVIWWEDEM